MKPKFLFNRTKGIITLGLSAGLLIGHPAFAGNSSYPDLEYPQKRSPGLKKCRQKNKKKLKQLLPATTVR